MSWLSTLFDEWKSILGLGGQKPIADLRLIEARLHSLLKGVSWVLVGLSIFSYLAMSLVLCWIKWTSSSPESTIFGFIVQVLIFLLALVFLGLIVPLISLRTRLERNIQRSEQTDTTFEETGSPGTPHRAVPAIKNDVEDDLPRKTFWDAFPFASLVFFLVAVFMLFDIAYGGTSDTPEKMLLKLCLYLVAAIVTSIVVLFGAHLARFEGAVTALTKNANVASQKAERAALVTESATNEIKQVSESTRTIIKQSSNFIESASGIDYHLREIASTAGLEILSLRSDAAYRIAAQKFPKGEVIDRYIAARSCQGLMSDDAICLGADHSRLPSDLFPSARNMVSSFLEEMAWDLGERCLVTNSRNYTNSLVGVARGFEEVIKIKRNAGGKDAKRAERWRVFYLTHTIISPAELLNWPEPVRAENDSDSCSLCRIHPFMFDYMTYCRYFAAASDDIIHARLIRTLAAAKIGSGHYKTIAASPDKFDEKALSSADCHLYRLPSYCNPWGIPVWTRLEIKRGTTITYPLKLYERHLPPHDTIITNGSHDPYAFLFCYIPGSDTHWHPPKLNDSDPYSLLWPLYLEENAGGGAFSDEIRKIAGTRPNLEELSKRLFDFLVHPTVGAGLMAYYSSETRGVSPEETAKAHKMQLMKDEIDLFRSKVHRIREEWQGKSENSVKAASKLLLAFEHFTGTRWGFHGRANENGDNVGALDLWEDVQTAIMLLVNVLLAQQEKGEKIEEKVVDFYEWFANTFHSNRELGLYYLDADLEKYADEQHRVGSFTEEEIRQWKKLVNEEFALIGIIELPDGDIANEQEFIREALGQWVAGKDGAIQRIMGLRSSIQVPWKHAEIAWYWPCKQGIAELKRLTEFYRVAMEKGKNIATK